MVKRKFTGPLTDNHGDASSSAFSFTKRPRLESSRPRSPSIPATPSTNASGEPAGGEDDQTLSGSDNEERQAALLVDWDAMEEVFRPQIEAKRAANASRHGTVAESGIIESVQMCQFMCHKFLTFEFGDQLNFIIGHNGSGKSAILAAITVALGGNAIATGRGNGIKSLIREGQSKAEVSVVLKNAGHSAHKPEVFGDRIKVIRTFTRQGASSYKISSQNGDLISTHKADLQRICDQLEIQVDNPLNILTQESAKKFLGGTKSSDKYALFLRGTHLKQLWDEYSLTGANIELTKQILGQKAGDLPVLKERLETARNEYKEALKAQGLREKQSCLRAELAWAHVYEKEQELDEAYQTVAVAERRLKKVEELLAVENQVLDASQAVCTLEADHDNATRMAKEIWEKREQVQRTSAAKKRELNSVKAEEKSMNDTMLEYQREIAGLDLDLSKETQTLEEDVQAKREKLNIRMEVVQDNIAVLQGELASAGTERDRLITEIAQADYQREEAQRQVDVWKGKKQELEGKMGLHRVIEAIKVARWHGRSPIGPLGMFVQLDNSAKWGDLMRVYIGHQMRAFAITDARDLRTLKAILVKTGNPKNNVIISEFDEFDYSTGEPPSEYLTPLRVLRFTNDWVKRILINSSSIERQYLATSWAEADYLLKHRGGGVAMTSNLFRLTLWKIDGGRKTDALPKLHPKDPRVALFQPGNSSLEQIRLCTELGDCQDSLAASLAHLKDREMWHANLMQSLEQCKTLGRAINTQVNMQMLALQELEAESQQDAPVNLIVLQDTKKEKESAKAELKQQFTHLEKAKIDLQHELHYLERQISDLKREGEQADQTRQLIAGRIEDQAVKRTKALNSQRHFTNKLRVEQTKVKESQNAADAVRKNFEEWTEKADEISEKVETKRPSVDVRRELDSLSQALVDRDLRNPKSGAVLMTEERNAHAALERNIEDRKALRRLSTALAHSLKLRLDQWFKWRTYCSVSCKFNFAYNLSQRGYYGQVIMDHEACTLDLKVQTDDQAHGSSQGHKKDPLSLSGGEKSFSTLCLLLALWETCGCPIRCLDEFDVFMDSLIRRISIKMLIDTAKAAHGKQYILITPQDIPNVFVEPPVVKISQMADPRS